MTFFIIALSVIGWFVNLKLYNVILSFCDYVILNYQDKEKAKHIATAITLIPFGSITTLFICRILLVIAVLFFGYSEDDDND